MTEAGDQIAAQLRAADPDRYLSVLYAPAAKRADLFALYGFNAETAAIRDRIKEPLPGEVRLQWWRDVIGSGDPQAGAGHPLAMALVEAIERNGLPRAAFQNYLDARIFDLYDDPMPSRTDLEGHLGETASAIIQLAALILDKDAAQGVAESAGHAGCAQGIAGLLTLVPLHRARGQCFIPTEILASAGTNAEGFVAGSDKQSATRALAAMIALGRDHWSAFVASANRLPDTVRPAFLAPALAPLALGAVSAAEGGALTDPVRIAEWRKHWRMLRLALGGRW